MTKTENM